METLKISFIIAELLGYFQSEPSERITREPELIKWLEAMAAELSASRKKAVPLSAEEAKRDRGRVLSLIPDTMVIPAAMKLFAYLTACQDKDGKHPYQLIVEKGEIPAPPEYYASRSFFLGKKVTALGKDGKSIDLCLSVELQAISNNAFPEIEVVMEQSEASKKAYQANESPLPKAEP
jgi:hypothetical protein